jgi:two-component system, OmpR family, alkaline phosphatase synthesis response regulator PhoP
VIFIVEDETALVGTLELNLKLEGYQTVIAKTGKSAIEIFQKNLAQITLVLLDIMLPDTNGFELCRIFKQKKPLLPIIFLTAKNQSIDKIEGLKLGADDYITKPFELEELLLRVSNLLKRVQSLQPLPTLTVFSFASNTINFETFEIKNFNGNIQTLSKREIGLLKLLAENENKVISRDMILEKLWDVNDNASSRTIDNYILNFRKIFEKNPREPLHFHSIRGVGYKFTP